MTKTMRITRGLRWLAVVSTIVAASLCAPSLRDLYWLMFAWMPSGHLVPLGYFLATVLLFSAVSWLRPKPKHWSKWWIYPPSALSIVIGYIVFAFLEASDLYGFVRLCWPLGALICCVLLHWYLEAEADQLKSAETKDTELEPSSLIASLSSQAVLHWVKDQSPGRDRTRDFVGLAKTVNKLLAIVTNVRVSASKPSLLETCVIMGPFGSGKSTFVEHLRCEAEKQSSGRKIIVAVTSCWGFESSEKAQEHILEAAVDRLHELIDCGAIRKLPRAYSAVLRDNKGWAAAAGHVVASFSEPAVTLGRLSSLLELVDRTLVVVVEDIDRGGDKFDMRQLMAVFHHLRQIPRVSFILTLSAPPPIELGRIAECIHRFHGLRPETGAAIIRKFSESIRSGKTIYPDSLAPALPNTLERTIFPSGPDWKPSAVRLARTLRMLKACLHAVHEEWSELDGEVNLDEFIAFVILREAAPAAHVFMTENAEKLRGLSGLPLPADHKARDDRLADLGQKWQALVEKAEFDAKAAGELLGFLFSGTSGVFSVETSPRGSRYQAMRTDDTYLRQMQDGAAVAGGRDQPALLVLKAFPGRPEPTEYAEAFDK